MSSLTLAAAPAPTLRLTVLVPAYNEAESLPELHRQIRVELDKLTGGTEILVIDDGSTDDTAGVVRALAGADSSVRLVSFRRNYGKSAALAVGFAEARGEIIITMDADLQDDPAEIPRLLARLDEGFDVVSGWKQNRQDPIMKTVPSKLFNAVTSAACGLRLHDFNCGLKAWRREAARSLEVYGELHRYLPALSHLQGFRVTEIPVKHHARRFGTTKFGSNRFINGFLDLLAVMFLHSGSRSPLHVFGRVGLLFGFVGGGILAYFAVIWISGQWLKVRPLLLFGVGLVILATQFISLGLLGEMIARGQQQDRTYAIRDRIG
ncbi:MAG TPA: glycosyltransferase family 2 protein [Candidatus Eisenbacteria bacterium]